MLSPEELGEGPPGALVPCPRSQSWTPVEATSSTSAALSQILLEVTESPANLGQGNGVGGGAGEAGKQNVANLGSRFTVRSGPLSLPASGLP